MNINLKQELCIPDLGWYANKNKNSSVWPTCRPLDFNLFKNVYVKFWLWSAVVKTVFPPTHPEAYFFQKHIKMPQNAFKMLLKMLLNCSLMLTECSNTIVNTTRRVPFNRLTIYTNRSVQNYLFYVKTKP